MGRALSDRDSVGGSSGAILGRNLKERTSQLGPGHQEGASHAELEKGDQAELAMVRRREAV